jgi:hypothetical protein
VLSQLLGVRTPGAVLPPMTQTASQRQSVTARAVLFAPSLSRHAMAAVMSRSKALTFSPPRAAALTSRPETQASSQLLDVTTFGVVLLAEAQTASHRHWAGAMSVLLSRAVPGAFSPEPSCSSESPPQAASHSTAVSYPGYVSLKRAQAQPPSATPSAQAQAATPTHYCPARAYSARPEAASDRGCARFVNLPRRNRLNLPEALALTDPATQQRRYVGLIFPEHQFGDFLNFRQQV